MLRGLSGFTNQIATAYAYDEMGRLTLVTNEHAGAAYTYDVPGRRMTKSYGNGDVTVSDVDVEGRPISISTTNQGALVQGWSYGYNSMGMITSITDTAETRVFEYDAVYRLTGESRTSAAGVESIGWAYDAAGNRLSRTSDDSAVSYTYNADNELTGMTSADTLTVTGTVEPGAGNSDWYESYAATGGQAARVSTNTGAFAIPGVPVSEGTNTLVVTVEDAGGNISTQSVTFTRQSLGGTQPIVYDDNGNLVERNVWTNGVLNTYAYDYDMENRLTRVTRDEDPILECWYDAAGRRIAKREVVGAQTNAVQYVWEGWALLAVLDAAGNLLESYTRGVGVAYDVGSLVAVHHHDGAYTNETIYLHNNHRGDVTTVRSGTNTLATYRYSAYGSVRQHSGIYECRLGFSSKELDAPVGFLYFGFRFCDPRMARWLSKDPIGVAGGLNQYEAFANCPLNSLDPLALCDHGGKSSWIPAAIIGGMFPKSGLNQMKHLWSQMSSLNAYMKNFPKGSVAWRAFNAELTSMYARYTATHGATYTAGGSLTGYGALGLTRWGSGLSIRAIGGLAAGTAVVGGVIGHEISQIEIGGGQTVAEVVGGGLYRITPGLWNRLGRLWW